MGLVAVKDQALLDQLEGGSSPSRGLKPVTDEKLLFELENGGKPRSMGEEALRQVGLTARAAGPTAAGAATGAAIGSVVPGVGTVIGGAAGATAMTVLQLVDKLGGTNYIDKAMDMMGVPKPEGAKERVVGDVVGAMAGQAGTRAGGKLMAEAGGPVVRKVGEMLSASPGGQTLAAAGGSGASGVTRELGGGPVAQTVAGVLGAASPGAVQATGESTVRGLLRGGETGRARTAANIKTFEDAGTTPTVGQATENRGTRLTETLLSKTPGSAGVMADKARTQAAEIGTKIEGMAEELSPRATATKAGAAIEKGTEKFVEEFRLKQKELYDRLDKYISKDRPVDMTNTANKLQELNAGIPGAPELSKFFKNSTIQAIEGAMKSDTQDLTTRLPYEALKKLRTLVGAEMENTSLTSSVPRSKWSALYGSLSDDLAVAAKEAGPEAERAFARANLHTKAGHERIGLYLDRVAGKDTVEKVFQAAVNPSEIREGASTVNAVLRSLDTDARDTVRAAFLKRLGTAGAGKQDATGEVFSPETFLTNWNKISPEAKMTLFADSKGTLRENMDQIAKAASNLREGSKIFANPSGTEAALSTRLGISGIVLSALLGHPGVAAGLAGGMGTANVGSRLLFTNPDFVKWLAKTTTLSEGMLPGQLDSLSQIAAKQEPDVRKAIEDYRDEIRKKVPATSTLEAQRRTGTSRQ